ncbi:MAG: DUF2791 family P-loop domain-containing protein [Micromonosporaceae bacterium]|nr:DUF2791 family P-loop domain-containing protein [Micromonosporaceae bacterium]
MAVHCAPPPLEVAGYLEFLEREYLAGYVDQGGAAVKLVSTGDPTAATQLASGLTSLGNGFQHAVVDAAATRIHMIDQVFAAVAQQIDWVALAEAVVRTACGSAGFPPPDGDLSIVAIARHHDVDPTELYRSVRRAIEAMTIRDHRLGSEFRTAMLRLCQERLGRGDVTPDERETVLCWLRCERLPASELRKLALHSKISRANARQMLMSLTHWLRRAGRAGLVLHLDTSRLAVARRPPLGLRQGVYYSKAAVLDAYELLRQLVDGTDQFAGLMAVASLPAQLITDDTRGLPAYTALQLRVIDEVRDRRRANPYAALVRVGPQGGDDA